MRVLLQRVSRADVRVAGEVCGQIGAGVVLLSAICNGDDEALVAKMASKLANLRIFSDAEGKFAHSLLETGGGAMVISQFTLYAETRKGRRPSFTQAARPETARPLLETFADSLSCLGVAPVASGVFGADMRVSLCNEGPVTIWLDSDDWLKPRSAKL